MNVLPVSSRKHMSLEDYIREQERKAKDAAKDVKASASEAWQDTKEAGRNLRDRSSDVING